MTDRHRKLAAQHRETARSTSGFTGFFDGCCEPRNPGGTAGYGAVVFGGRYQVWQHSGMSPAAPATSTNVAEYLAVIAIFEWLQLYDPKTPIPLFGDSRLVVCQLWGWPTPGRLWRIGGVDMDVGVREPGHYAAKAVEAREKPKLLPNCRGFWIPREDNTIADYLSKAELIRAGVKFVIQPQEASA